MALDFPSSPTNGQVYDNYYWDSSIQAWRSNGSKNGLSTRLAAEELATATSNKSGLVPIIPTSVTVASGSASIASNGTVTLTSADTPVINGIFSAAYTNYKIIITNNNGVSDTMGNPSYVRFASGGTQNSSNNYTYTVWYSQSGVNGNGGGTGTATNWGQIGYHRNVAIDVYTPFVAGVGTTICAQGVYNHTVHIAEAGYNAAASFDGFVIANNYYSATVKVYGYR